MPSASRLTTPVGIDLDVVEGRYAELDDHTVSFETFTQDLDVTPYFRDLPGDAHPVTVGGRLEVDHGVR